jgi:hypothetical protein
VLGSRERCRLVLDIWCCETFAVRLFLMRTSVAKLKCKPFGLAASAGHLVANNMYFRHLCLKPASEMLLTLRLDVALGAVSAQVLVSR